MKYEDDLKVTLKKGVFGLIWEGSEYDFRMYEFPFYIHHTEEFKLARWL